MAKLFKGKIDTGFKIVLGFLALVVVAFIIWGAIALIKVLPDGIKSLGAAATSTPIGDTGFFASVINVLLGEGAMESWESLILHFAIFVILFFAFSDIVTLFSTFTETTSWVIGFGLTLIVSVTKMLAYIAGIFALTAGIGAVGIAIIIGAAIF